MSNVTVDAFRQALPTFGDSAVYDDPTVQFWLTFADNVVNRERWGDAADQGIMMFVAHFITRDAVMAREVAANGIGGLRGGMISSEGADGVQVSFNVTATDLENGGHWNDTIWGKRYLQFSRLFGAGPIQVGAPPAGTNVSAYAYGSFPYNW
jgi:hypothetical protein